MKPKTKDRLLTGGVVLLICAVGFGTPGCSVQRPYIDSHAPLYASQGCHTDFECEMMEYRHKQQVGDEEPTTTTTTTTITTIPRWKLWTSIGVGLLVSGYIYARQQDKGGDQRGIDVRTPGVNCDVAGRPGGGCAQ